MTRIAGARQRHLLRTDLRSQVQHHHLVQAQTAERRCALIRIKVLAYIFFATVILAGESLNVEFGGDQTLKVSNNDNKRCELMYSQCFFRRKLQRVVAVCAYDQLGEMRAPPVAIAAQHQQRYEGTYQYPHRLI